MAAQPAPGDGTDLVVLDVVVRDRDGTPILDLTPERFTVSDSGRDVPVTTLRAVSASGSTAADQGRTIVLILDTAGVNASGTLPIQTVARGLLSQARAGDDVTVVRLGRRTDEPYGDLLVAADRITTYRAGSTPYVPGETQELLLTTIAALSTQMQSLEPRRKAIVCVGALAVCNPAEPLRTARRSMLQAWHAAVSAAARANVAVFAAVPSTLRSRERGIVEFTGGEIYAGTNVVESSVRGVWSSVSHYYLLGFWDHEAAVDLRPVRVAVRGARVSVRRAR